MTWKLCFASAALALMAAACASAGGDEAAPPRASECAALANVDLAELRALAEQDAAENDDAVRRLTGETPLPAAAENADTRIRVRVPPTGMWALDNRVTLWRTDEGWRVARRDINYRAPPPPPPPPDAGPDWTAPPDPNQIVKEGPVDPERGRQLDALLADPCLQLEPDRYTWKIPMRRGPDWVCVPDSSYWAAEIIVAGRPPRLVSIACENRTLTSELVRFAAGLGPPAPPAPETPPEELRPFTQAIEMHGDFEGRAFDLTLADWFYTREAPRLGPGEIWTQTVPVFDGPIPVRLSIEGCPAFAGAVTRSVQTPARLIVRGCDIELVSGD